MAPIREKLIIKAFILCSSTIMAQGEKVGSLLKFRIVEYIAKVVHSHNDLSALECFYLGRCM